jgi:hypothetical protein
MIASTKPSRSPLSMIGLAALTLMLLTLVGASDAQAEAPIKLLPSFQLGWEVNATTKGYVCTVQSKDTCQPGKESVQPGGFVYPRSVAAAPNGNIYVTDGTRVEEFKADGEFVLTFGREVNETKDKAPGTSQAEKDLCTEHEVETEAVKCGAGVVGVEGGGFEYADDVAVDPRTENVYVLEAVNARVDEYTANGRFVLTIGKEVNETEDDTPGAGETAKNVCTSESKDQCKAGVRASESNEKGAFAPVTSSGLLAVGSDSEHLLYVAGNQNRVQEFNDEGEWKGQIKLPTSIITTVAANKGGSIKAIAVVSTADRLYLAYSGIASVYELDLTSGDEIASFGVPARQVGGVQVEIGELALDSAGQLAVAASEEVRNASGNEVIPFGSLYEPSGGRLISSFALPYGQRLISGHEEQYGDFSGINFNSAGELFAAVGGFGVGEVVSYTPVNVGELRTGASTCKPGPEAGTDVSLDCVLEGDVNPYDVSGTQAWFQWGPTCAFGSQTSKLTLKTEEALLPVNGTIEGVRPNESFCYQLIGEDQLIQSPERLEGSKAALQTPAVAPQIVGVPRASQVSASSAVLFGELNPENAPSEAFFEYGAPTALAACGGVQKGECPGVSATNVEESSLYGKTGVTFSIAGLQPATQYAYRLVAHGKGGSATGGEGTLVTAPAAIVQAQTSPAGGVAQTSAVAFGLVNPDGETASYSFRLGVWEGASTQYGTVFSGSTGSGTSLEEESYTLTGLQPGTTYVYKIAIKSGYGTAEGAPVTFTTAGLPAALALPGTLAQLAVPQVSFPNATTSVTAKKLTKAQQLAQALKMCAKKPRKQRAGCERAARKKYATAKKKKK